MKKWFLAGFISSLAFLFIWICSFQPMSREIIPSIHKGRIRPLDVSARLWLKDFYAHPQILRSHQQAFNLPSRSALDLAIRMHFLGHTPWDEAPFFWMDGGISYNQIKKMPTSEEMQGKIRLFESYRGVHQDLSKKNGLLQNEQATPKEIALQLELDDPFAKRLAEAGDLFKILPGKHNGLWYAPNSLLLKIYHPMSNQFDFAHNFTLYAKEEFARLRTGYLESVEQNVFSDRFADDLVTTYKRIEGKPYTQAAGKTLSYPSLAQLKAEVFYYQSPLIELTMVLYGFGILLFVFAFSLKKYRLNRWAYLLVTLAFSINTFILILRCFILQRPPVSNMYETVIYVPWVAMLCGFVLQAIWKDFTVVLASSLVAEILLIVLQVTQISSSMENVQAVLDSQYWLLIHVLLIVGSYGVFLCCGVLGHLYLAFFFRNKEMIKEKLARYLLHSMYIGTAMLIPGTILGGVWAAESWGRFWDWDPKESWAFISSCTYLLAIHAYTFNHIKSFGLAIFSIIGLQAVAFTWYGVNYILATGMHSYGFGQGGQLYYYLFVLADLIFICMIFSFRICKRKNEKKVLKRE